MKLGTSPAPVRYPRLLTAAMALLGASLLAALIPGRVLAQAAVAGANDAHCLGCHDDPALKDPAGHSLDVPAARFEISAHRKLACATCHTDALTARHPRQRLAPVTPSICAGCHQETIDKLAHSVHGAPGLAVARCADCHGDVHVVQPAGSAESAVSAVNQVQRCGQCHREIMSGYLTSPHAFALLAEGLTAAPACTDCHGSGHDIQSASSPQATIAFAQVPETCGRCHAGILSEWRTSAHGLLWSQGGTGGPVCTTCHEAHAIAVPTSAPMRERFPTECGNCHATPLESYHDSFHGKASSLGWTAVATCSDCHTAHRILAPADQGSSVNPAHLAATCGRCHARETNAAFLTFDPHADPRDPTRNRYVHWVWVGMTWLLLGVFGFFGLHDLLWLQRTLVGSLRHEYSAERTRAGPYVRRFTGTQIALHAIVIVSFLLLAATGLPLKFAAAPWAPKLMALWGGPHAAGVLHRVAAVITFGYFASHVVGVLYQMLIRHKHGVLWGPRSMVPQPSDIRELFANVGYFLYLRPRPAFGHWTYWEKFDYMAVFWGVAIIGLTGLMLWFPGFFTRFLPGWTLNAAYIAHSDEALLATGFIFIFHFFHTHLRPEVFPMDPAVFTGRVPLERFKAERPREYEQLVAHGQLEGRLVAAPTSAELTRAYVLGLLAVAIGIALAIGIFVALLGTYAR